MAKRKRGRDPNSLSRSQRKAQAEDNAQIHQGDSSAVESTASDRNLDTPPEVKDDDENGNDWETVKPRKRAKRSRKKTPKKSTEDPAVSSHDPPVLGPTDRPLIYHSNVVRQESALKFESIQKLILYILDSGEAPTFVGVQNRAKIQKVVVIRAVGLDQKLFKPLVDSQSAHGEQAKLSEVVQFQSLNPFSSLTKAADPVAVSEENPSKDSTDGQAEADNGDDADDDEATNEMSPDYFLPSDLDPSTQSEATKAMAEIFNKAWPVVAPGDSRFSRFQSPSRELIRLPLPCDKNGVPSDWVDKPEPVTSFEASLKELRNDDYEIHPCLLESQEERDQEMKARRERKHGSEDGWVDADIRDLKNQQDPAAEEDIILALDCEMCQTADEKNALARVSILDGHGTLLYDTLVKPPSPITDYRTPYSGITPLMLDPVTTTLPDVQQHLLKLFQPSTILVGHSLNSDLDALRMTHPRIIDTSIIYPHVRPPYKESLRTLAKKFLARTI